MSAAPLDIDIPPSCAASSSDRPAVELLVRVLAGACLGSLVVVAAAIVARRAAGAASEPLSPAAMSCGGALVAVLAALAQWPHLAVARARMKDRGLRKCESQNEESEMQSRTPPTAHSTILHSSFPSPFLIDTGDVLGLGVPLVVAVLLAAAMTLPGTSAGPALLLWLPLVGSQAAIAWLWRGRVPGRRRSALAEEGLRMEGGGSRGANATEEPSVAHPPSSILDPSSSEPIDEVLPAGVVQQWTRRIVNGADVLEGMARAGFVAGDRVTNLHVGVCPPFAGTPEVFAEIADGPAASVRVAEALPFGIRMEVRLAEIAKADCEAVVAVVASWGSSDEPG